MRAQILSALAIGIAAGCAAPPDQIPVSPSAGPGPNIMSAFDAGVIFTDVCLTRGPNFEDAVQGLSGFSFTQNAATGTYYHNTANLSVKVRDEQCSMVYGVNANTEAEIDAVVSGLADGTASVLQGTFAPSGIDVRSSRGPDDLRYFRLGIFSPVTYDRGPS